MFRERFLTGEMSEKRDVGQVSKQLNQSHLPDNTPRHVGEVHYVREVRCQASGLSNEKK